MNLLNGDEIPVDVVLYKMLQHKLCNTKVEVFIFITLIRCKQTLYLECNFRVVKSISQK